MPAVSVIIPVYNVEKYIGRCLDSIFSQTFQDYEVIVVNDGSPDASQKVIDAFASQHPDKLVSLSQQNAGVSAARNRALEQARGDYLVFLDSDDFVEPDYLQTLYDAAQRDRADMVICGYKIVDPQDRVQSVVRPGRYAAQEHEEWALRIMTICMRIYRRRFWTDHRLKFELGVRGEDIPVNLVANSLGKVSIIPYCGYHYVQHTTSATHTLKGLTQHRLPLEAIENAVRYIQSQKNTNSSLFFELSVIRILTSFIFEFGVHSPKDRMAELSSYALRLLNTYFPRYSRNPYLRPNRIKIFPRYQRWGVYFFAQLCRFHGLKFCTRLLAK